MTTDISVPRVADIAQLPWEPSLHNMIVDATGRNILSICDYWIGEDKHGEAEYNHDATRAIAWYVLDAVNTVSTLLPRLMDYADHAPSCAINFVADGGCSCGFAAVCRDVERVGEGTTP